jgi:hypothetical protein
MRGTLALRRQLLSAIALCPPACMIRLAGQNLPQLTAWLKKPKCTCTPNSSADQPWTGFLHQKKTLSSILRWLDERRINRSRDEYMDIASRIPNLTALHDIVNDQLRALADTRCGFGILVDRDAYEFAKLHCRSRAAVVIEPVSADSLRETGIFADKARDFRRFPPHVGRTGSPETNPNARKAGISGLFSRLLGSLADRRNAWLGREGSNLRMAESKSV